MSRVGFPDSRYLLVVEDIKREQVEMKELPIIFSPKMVAKIPSGEKTVTRRLKFNGEPGDELWVRERFIVERFSAEAYCVEVRYSDGIIAPWKTLTGEIDRDVYSRLIGSCGICRPSIFMPRALSRIQLKVISARKEKLQDITIGDLLREGLTFRAFNELWDSLHPEGCKWEDNPLVWRIEFEVKHD